ncbi:Hypothetical protein I595_1778 [Croceitalea dokdonensis DOKDO 023]|uniref:Uncharacterized protein n=1 Tax=Croceitalea dokdonensis DOKDO 023 TaxID=1300341 RepID=A0A0P7AVW2_9FLAO|nr:Hypothetical protein I595_1778 [Croceitalea dokdonensis DOKDO 023]
MDFFQGKFSLYLSNKIMNRRQSFLMLKDEKLLQLVWPISLGKWSIFLLDCDCAA